jgi:hypothetical protein
MAPVRAAVNVSAEVRAAAAPAPSLPAVFLRRKVGTSCLGTVVTVRGRDGYQSVYEPLANRPYSVRKAVNGSDLVALRAGIRQASNAVPTRRSDAWIMVTGSIALIP